eukprot:1194702-Amorphochlora_amoeboformis.AAC.2
MARCYYTYVLLDVFPNGLNPPLPPSRIRLASILKRPGRASVTIGDFRLIPAFTESTDSHA